MELGGAVRGVTASTVTLRPQYLNKMNDSSNLQLGAVHRYESVDLDYDLFKSFSETDYPGTREISFTARNVGFTITRADSRASRKVAVRSVSMTRARA